MAGTTSTSSSSTTGAGITDYTPILVSVLLVVLIVVIGYLLAFTFRKTIRSWFGGGGGGGSGLSKIRSGRSAAAAVTGMTAAAGGGGGGDRACSDNNTGSVYSGNDKLFDVFISYAPEDGDLVEGSLAANLEHGATSYRLCLHQRDFPPTTPLADTVSVAVETSTRAVIVLSRAYLATQWVSIRPSFMKAIKDNNTKVVFIQVEQLDDLDAGQTAPELRNLREDSPLVHWQDHNFWTKLRYFLPEPVYLTFHRSVTMRGTLQQQQQNHGGSGGAAGNLYQPVMHPHYPARIELLATNYINSGRTLFGSGALLVKCCL
ncbi:MAG: TIR domain-containing protein [Gammaproteobacteria bacterium]|nr:TIR domain-containing protein [Gammaproteobacteria bacterium]